MTTLEVLLLVLLLVTIAALGVVVYQRDRARDMPRPTMRDQLDRLER